MSKFLALLSSVLPLLSLIEGGIAAGIPAVQNSTNTYNVFIQHIVGNTNAYKKQDWKNDFKQIAAGGIDAVSLTLGSDSWQTTQLNNAYTAANGTKVKLFLKFDFSSFPCNASSVANAVNQFSGNSNQFKIDGKPLISSYLGQCLGNDGWKEVKNLTGGYLMPYIENIEGKIANWDSLDAWQCYECAWPVGPQDELTDDAEGYFDQLNLGSAAYATTVSPWKFSHYPDSNYYRRGDADLFASRWQQLVRIRDQTKLVELVSWNDFATSTYIGPIKTPLPEGTTWVEGFPHTAFFEMTKYYIQAYKTGSYPVITEDVIYYYARPHPALAVASSDLLPRPEVGESAADYLFADIYAAEPSQLTITAGNITNSFDIWGPGKTAIATGIAPGEIKIVMRRNGQNGTTVIDHTDSALPYSDTPELYNYNVYAGIAKAGN